MKISVVTVCYNSAATIADTVDSFLRQNYDDREMVVVDGGSKDATLDIVRSSGSGKISIVSEPDRGIFHAMSKGLKLFSGDAVGYLNSDDCFHDDGVLTAIAAGLKKNSIVHGHLDFVDNHRDANPVRLWRARAKPNGGFATGWMPAHPTFYVRRDVAEAVGDFDETMPIAADYDWMLRAVEVHGFSVGLVDEVLVNMLPGGNSTAGLSTYLKGNIESLRSRRRWLGSGVVDYAFFAKPARKIGQFITPLSGSRAA